MHRKIISLLIVFILIATFALPIETAYAADYSYIKVKLSSMGSVTSVAFTVNGEYYIKESPYYPLVNGKTYTVKTSGSGIALSDGTTTSYIGVTATFIRTKSDSATNWLTIKNPNYGTLNYPGDIKFSRNGTYIDTICTLFMETYLVGVVAHEMSPSWPMEALKAQAVAARTYAMRYINSSNTYDVVDTTSNQVYKGYSPTRDARVVEAVNATAGEVLLWGTTFADGVYSASNGGQTMTRKPKWGSTNYYHELKDDPYDKANPASPKFEFFFPKVVTTLNKLDSRLDTMIRELSVAALKKENISASASNIVVKGIESLTPHTIPEPTSYGEYPAGSYQFTKIDVTAIIDYSGSGTIPDEEEEELTLITTGVVKLQSSDRMRIRSGPSTSYSIAGYIENGATLDVYDIRDDDWLAIKYGSISGYVMKMYVELAPYEEEEEEPEELNIPGTVKGTAEDFVSVYQQASLDASVENALTGGTELIITEYLDTGWLKITAGDIVGYVLEEKIEYDASLLYPEDDDPTVDGHKVTVTLDYATLQDKFAADSSYLKYHSILSVRENTDENQWVLVASRYGHGIGMSQRGAQQMAQIGWSYDQILDFYYNGTVLTKFDLTEKELPEGIVAPTMTARTTTDGVNLRKGPSTSYPVIKSIDRNVEIYVISVSTWCNVYIPSLKLSGYMSKDYLAITNVNTEPDLLYTEVKYHDGVFEVNATNLNLRSAPVIANNIIRELPKDSRVKKLDSSGDWFKVIDKMNNIGWCSSDYLTQVRDAVVEPTATPEITSTPTISPSPTDTTVEPTLSPSPTPDPSESVTPTTSPDTTTEPTASPSPSPSDEVTPTPTPTISPSPTSTVGPSVENEMSGLVATGGTALLRIRNDASTKASIIGYIPDGTTITILEDRDDGWLYINYQTFLGYVIDDYVIYDGTREETGDALAEDDEEEDEVVTGTVKLDTSTRLRIRSAANTTASIVGYVPNNARVQILQTLSTGWLKIEYGGLSGYVSGDYIEINNSDQTTGTIVDCIYLSVRTGAGTTYTRLGVVELGTQHVLLSENDGWYKIKFENQDGWISGKYVSVDEAGYVEDEKEGITTADSLRVRKGPGLTYEQIGSLSLGSTVSIKGEENGFYKIDYNGSVGYISTAYVDITSN